MDDVRPKPPCVRDDALSVVKTLRAAGHSAYFAGGCVRDLLMGKEPKDYDVATDAVPQKVRSLFKNTQAVGAAFGVILVRIGASVVEVATFRSEGKYLDGRRPSEVTFTTAEEDAKRRDFTINGLFLDPITNDVLDFVGGRADIESRTLRAIGVPDERFEEDHLRLLRAVRFAARFDLKIEPKTDEAIARHAKRLATISPERIAEELRTMLCAATRRRAFELLLGFGLLQVVLRFFKWPTRIDVGVFASLPADRSIPFGLALAGVVTSAFWEPNELTKAFSKTFVSSAANALRQALRPSNEELDAFVGTMEGVRLLLGEMSLAVKKRFLARPTAGLSRTLFAALAARQVEAQRQTVIEPELAELEKTEFAPPPLVTGDDLTAAGLTPGPIFRRVLDGVYDEQLEGRVATKEEALRWALEAARGKNP